VDNAIIYMVMMKLTPDQKKRQPFAFLDGSASAQQMADAASRGPICTPDSCCVRRRCAPLRIGIAVADVRKNFKKQFGANIATVTPNDVYESFAPQLQKGTISHAFSFCCDSCEGKRLWL
jgi:hypothetical protein